MTSILMSSESYIDISAELAVDWACILAALHFSQPLLPDKQQMIKWYPLEIHDNSGRT